LNDDTWHGSREARSRRDAARLAGHESPGEHDYFYAPVS